jgi:uncharacterized protein YceH (UPF0502 family)
MQVDNAMEESAETATSEGSANETLAQPQLNTIEARILGCLIEKAAITPDVYPLTVNAAVAACNQKTSREPLMNLELGAVGHALRVMADNGLTQLDPFSQRVPRYAHCFDAVYGVTPRQRAVLCVMLLRGPQTLNELVTRCERLTEFPSLDDVRDTLERLIERQPALVVRLPRGGGRREDRYMHLLSGPVAAEAAIEMSTPARARTDSDLDERVAKLEADVGALQEQIAKLIDRCE